MGAAPPVDLNKTEDRQRIFWDSNFEAI